MTQGFGSETLEIAVDTEAFIPHLEEDLDAFAAFLLSDVFQFGFPEIFKQMWAWLKEWALLVRVFPKLAIGLPRGFGKTTFIKLFCVWIILFTRKQFLCIVASTGDLAEAILLDIEEMLNDDNVIAIFGDWKVAKKIDRQNLKLFTFRNRQIIIRAVGAGTSIRGVNYRNHRPDVLIFEDIQTREQADSEVESRNLYAWLLGTAMKIKSSFGCMYIFVGNMYPTNHSILKKLKLNSEWTSFIVGGILVDGTSLWEKLQPIAQLVAEYKHDKEAGHPEIFQAEVLNDPNASANHLIDVNLIPMNPFPETEICQGNVIIIDPATDKLNANFTAIGYFEFYDGVAVNREVYEEILSPAGTIFFALEIALRKNCRCVVIEANAYQYTLGFWFEWICRQKDIIGIHAVPIYAGGASKNARIVSMFKQLIAQKDQKHPEIYLDDRVRAPVKYQITSFNPLKKDNIDNILDLLCYATRVHQEYGEFITYQTIEHMQSYGDSHVRDVFENCPV